MINDLKEKIIQYKDNNKKLVYLDSLRKSYNTSLLNSIAFSTTELFKDIIAHTSFLDGLQPMLWQRVKSIVNNINEIKSCPICGNSCLLSPNPSSLHFFRETCGSSKCKATLTSRHSHLTIMSESTRAKHSISQTNAQKEKLKLCQMIIDDISDKALNNKTQNICAVKSFIEHKLQQRNKNGMLFSKHDFVDNKELLTQIILLTSFIPWPQKLQSITQLKLNERAYCVLHDMKSVGKCIYCGGPTSFVNMNFGYRENCAQCADDKYRKTRGNKTLKEVYESIDKQKYEVIHFPTNTTTDELVIKCKICGTTTHMKLINGRSNYLENGHLCRGCEKYSSRPEQELRAAIASIYNGEVLANTHTIISPLELDIYLPEKKLAIEYDGLYFHNDNVVKPNYHILKTTKCEEHGIQLIHVFENEWIEKREIVLSRIKNLLGHHSKTLYARNCSVKQIDQKTSKQFQSTNHIQGPVNSTINLGLFSDDELVCVMAFGRPRFSKKYEWELLRFCSKLNYHVVGAAGKLLSYFEKNQHPKTLISYADRRWSIGKLYESLGFSCIHKSSPNYFYYKSGSLKLESRMKYQKKYLKHKLSNYDPTLSEQENMKANSYCRIFDSGNRVYLKSYHY